MIDDFRGEHRWLSNFHICPVMYDGMIYKSSEHAYMAAKAAPDDATTVEIDGVEVTMNTRDYIRTLERPRDAKRFGRTIPLRAGMERDSIRRQVMFEVVYDKFRRNPDLAYKLVVETAGHDLAEGNTWGDLFWGIDAETREGENHLGKILMIVRYLLGP